MTLRQSLRRLAFTLLAVFFVRLYLKWKKKAKEWKRKTELLLKLPSLPVPLENKYSLYLYGTIHDLIGRKIELTHDNVAKNFIRGCMTAFEAKELVIPKGATDEPIAEPIIEGKEEQKKRSVNDLGILCLWVLNPEHFIFHSNLTGGPRGAVIIRDISLVRECTSTKNLGKFVKGRAYGVSRDLIGDSVLATTGEVWHRQRKVIEKGFKLPLLKKQLPMILETSKDLVERLMSLGDSEKKEDGYVSVNLIEEMLKTTMDVLGRAAFSYDIGSLKCKETKDAPLYDAFETILGTLHKRVRNPFLFMTRKWLPTKQNRDFDKSLEILNNVIRDIIKTRQEQAGRGEEKEEQEAMDLLDILLQSDMKEKQILENMRTVLFAGHDTTAAALTWSFYLLAKHPDVLQKILEELESKLGITCEQSTGQKFKELDISIEELERLDYLNAVILEVLRLYPSAGFTKTCVEDVEVGGYVLPRGTDVMFLPYLTQRDPKNYDNPNAFVPQRWIEKSKSTGKKKGKGEGKRPDDVENQLELQAKLAKVTLAEGFFPFSLGKRNCVGRKLALLELRLVLLYVVMNFDIKLPDKQPEGFQKEPWLGMTAFPKDVHACFRKK